MNRMPLTCVIIPAYNEYKSLGSVLAGFLPRSNFTILVVDDASTDATAACARKMNAAVLRLARHEGKSEAVRQGLLYAHKRGYDSVVIMDADGQHDPASIQKLIRASKRSAMVIGSRYVAVTKPVSSPVRRFTCRVISACIAFAYGVKIYDPTSGFRLIRKEAIPVLASRRMRGFPELAMLPVFFRYGWNIREVSVQMRPRFAGTSSITLRHALYGIAVFAVQTVYFRITALRSV